ncbi:MAG: glycosyl hydrolase [Nitrosopumilales archaeon]|nr:glycosyl hydrolase [Nitrosopumilales archaeon]
MTILIAAMQDLLLSLESSKTGWKTHESLKGTHPQSVTFDPRNPNRAYCGTFGDGLWKSDDGGQTWDRVGKDAISSNDVTSVSVSRLEQGNKVYVGTEPSALYRSDDEGHSWQRMSTLNNLESSKSWSFPPRPWTSHVRWIESDANIPDYLFVAIEAGALVQSRDGGRTWIDRVEQGPYDTHTLATHQKAPKSLYSSAGDGYFESFDYGESWKRPTAGLKHHYLYGLAVDPADPHTIVVSASQSAWQAHSVEGANSLVYRRSVENDGGEWKAISNGLPESRGTIIAILAANPKNSGEFYAINNRGVFCSTDTGLVWRELDVSWSKEYLLQHPWALAIRGED